MLLYQKNKTLFNEWKNEYSVLIVIFNFQGLINEECK